jgi:hypothetical protein
LVYISGAASAFLEFNARAPLKNPAINIDYVATVDVILRRPRKESCLYCSRPLLVAEAFPSRQTRKLRTRYSAALYDCALRLGFTIGSAAASLAHSKDSTIVVGSEEKNK